MVFKEGKGGQEEEEEVTKKKSRKKETLKYTLKRKHRQGGHSQTGHATAYTSDLVPLTMSMLRPCPYRDHGYSSTSLKPSPELTSHLRPRAPNTVIMTMSRHTHTHPLSSPGAMQTYHHQNFSPKIHPRHPLLSTFFKHP